MRITQVILALAFASSCTPSLPEGVFVCAVDSDCPATWSCDLNTLRCRVQAVPFDAGTPDTSVPPVCVATDDPDASSVDSNCDGIDGVEAASVFVDGAGGNDTNDGSLAHPMKSIGAALTLAETLARHDVLVAIGTYQGPIDLADGVSIHGGYDAQNGWSRAVSSGTPTTVISASAGTAVVGTSIAMTTRLSNLRIVGANATTPGGSSIAMRLVDSSGIIIEDCRVEAGTALTGPSGVTPTSTPTAGTGGGMGAASQYNVALISTPLASNPPCTCGKGGSGTWGWSNPATSRDGGGGQMLTGGVCMSVSGTIAAGAGGSGSGQDGVAGHDGVAGTAGPHGLGGLRTAGYASTGVSVATGESGTVGTPGGGGGGGASGVAFSCGTSLGVMVSSTGANGGSGGCGGAPGMGGTNGGASVALYLWQSAPLVHRSTFVAGVAGSGGVGAPGQNGAVGGVPGVALAGSTSCPNNASLVANSGANGGRGGAGGPGGAGGGGAGGVSTGIAFGSLSSLSVGSTPSYVAGAAGAAGTSPGNAGQPGVVCSTLDVAAGTCLLP